MVIEHKIIETLAIFGELPTARLCAIAGIEYHDSKRTLERLYMEDRVIKKTNKSYTYWKLGNGKSKQKKLPEFT